MILRFNTSRYPEDFSHFDLLDKPLNLKLTICTSLVNWKPESESKSYVQGQYSEHNYSHYSTSCVSWLSRRLGTKPPRKVQRQRVCLMQQTSGATQYVHTYTLQRFTLGNMFIHDCL